MQPYFFPYLGYWQLLNYVDRFVFYDDVNYIKRGWINRNRILHSGGPGYITVPVRNASQNRAICELSIDESVDWRGKMLKSISNTYSGSPFYAEVFPVVEEIINHQSDNLAELLKHQVANMASFLEIGTALVDTSRDYCNSTLSGQKRILDICKQEEADTYVNPEGGVTLYDKRTFEIEGISLRFLTTKPICYRQRLAEFFPNLSIIDVLMETGKEGCARLLHEFRLTTHEQ